MADASETNPEQSYRRSFGLVTGLFQLVPPGL
jgi:hypothetical protein